MSEADTTIGADALVRPSSWKQAFDRFGLAAAGILITVMITQAGAIAGWVGSLFESDRIETGDVLPANSDLNPGAYDKIIRDAEKEDNQAAIMRSLSCLDTLAQVEWREFTDGLFIKGVICDNGNTVYQITDIPALPERTVYRGISAEWFKRKYLETVGSAPAAHTAAARETPSALLLPALPEARASLFLAQAGTGIICRRPLPDGRGLFQRIQTPNGCFDQIIDTYTGRVISHVAAPCQPC